ncbi:MAG TPA: hypothetical protein VIX59_13755 [Candidatus Binataceae bacterium]
MITAFTATPALAAKGSVEVGFIAVPPQGFQNALVNVISVRLNPKTTAVESDTRWVTIPVPSLVGTGSSGKPGDLQFDLNLIQSVPQLFNTATVKPNHYMLVEVILDNQRPGTLVPVCSSAGPLEGCVNYPMVLQSPGTPLTIAIPVPVTKNKLTQVIITLNVAITNGGAPSVTGGAYTVTVTPTVAVQSNLLATVTGSTHGASGGKPKKNVLGLSVTAETMGTNTIIASAPVSGGIYTLALPAAGDIGTLYDVYVSGSGVSYMADRLPALLPGSMTNVSFDVAKQVKLGSIQGKIADACTGLPLQGATLQLLVPPAENSSADCTATDTAAQCVSVATATTDNNGNYPLPGTAVSPAQFNNVPIGPTFTMQISAPGYDTVLTPVTASGNTKQGGKCTAGNPTPDCDFALTTSYIVGTLNLNQNPPPGTNVMFQVFAENTGTNTIQSALPTPITIRPSTNTANFTLNVPTKGTFDLFASAIDLFQGATDPYPGHTIVVKANVTPQKVCPAPTMPTETLVGTMDCVGHGSIALGSVSNPNSGTTVQLSKNGVDLMSAPVIPLPPAPSPNNTFSFCTPADDYDVLRFQAAFPTPGVSPVEPLPPTAVGTPQAVTIIAPDPEPSAKPSPCPTTCSFTGGTCPGVCKNTVPDPL